MYVCIRIKLVEFGSDFFASKFIFDFLANRHDDGSCKSQPSFQKKKVLRLTRDVL